MKTIYNAFIRLMRGHHLFSFAYGLETNNHTKVSLLYALNSNFDSQGIRLTDKQKPRTSCFFSLFGKVKYELTVGPLINVPPINVHLPPFVFVLKTSH